MMKGSLASPLQSGEHARIGFGCPAEILGNGKTDGVIGYLLEKLVNGHQREAGLSQENKTDQGTDGADVGERTAAEKGAGFAGLQFHYAGGAKGQQPAGRQGKKADEGQSEQPGIRVAYDPDRPHDGHRVQAEKGHFLQQFPQIVDGKGEPQPVAAMQDLDGHTQRKSENDDSEGIKKFGHGTVRLCQFIPGA